jgi:hypothetical protein
MTATIARNRRDEIIYVRATGPEKDAIYARASDANLSASQFLIRLATEDRPPPSRAERERLERLLFILRRTTLHLRQLGANTSLLRLAGADEEVRSEMAEAACLLQELARMVRGRL